MDRKELKDKITAIETAFWDSYGALAKEFRDTYVVPFLKEHGLLLDTGMGSCTVETLDSRIRFYEDNDWEFYPRPATDEEWEPLNAQVKAIQAKPGWVDLWYVLNLRSSLEDPRMCMGASMDPYDPRKES